MRPRDLPTTFHAVAEPCSQFHQQSVQLGDVPSTSVKLRAAGRPAVKLCQLLCSQETLHQVLSTFRVARSPSSNIHQLFVRPGDLPSSLLTFCAAGRLCQLLSTFRVAGRPSSNFRQNFRIAGRPSVNFHQLSVPPRDLPSIFVNFRCGRETFHQLLSTFRAARRPSMNFCELSMRL